MLVLSRKLHETILVGDTIRVRVVAIRGNHVRLGIEAPDDVHIMRQELCPRMHVAPDMNGSTHALPALPSATAGVEEG